MGRVSKERQEQTLNDMKQRRYEDTLFLREIIKQKIAWAVAEKEKGIEIIKQHENQIQTIKTQITRLEGCIMVLNELSKLENKPAEEKTPEGAPDENKGN